MLLAALLSAVSLHGQTLAPLKLKYDSELTRIGTKHDETLNSLLDTYERTLERIVDISKQKGELDTMLAARKELARFKEEKTVPTEPSAPLPELLQKARSGYHDAHSKAVSAHDVKAKDLTAHYVAALDRLVRDLTRKDAVDEALLAKQEKERAEFILADAESRVKAAKPPPEPPAATMPGKPRIPILKAAQAHPEDAKPFEGHWYKVFPGHCMWEDAKERCEKMGGYLACAETNAELEWLKGLAEGRKVWLGGSRLNTHAPTKWLTGASVTMEVKKDWVGGDYLFLHPKGVLWYRRHHGNFPDFKGKPNIEGFICEWEK